VAKNANKDQIARAVEDYYRVNVIGVNVINIPSKRRRTRKGFAVKPGYRKAIVKIKRGQSIEVLPK
jgi:large subunit ribosomal protein L23